MGIVHVLIDFDEGKGLLTLKIEAHVCFSKPLSHRPSVNRG